MPPSEQSLPRLCYHKGRDLAYVRLPVSRRFIYFGPWDADSTREAYEKWAKEFVEKRGYVEPKTDRVTLSRLFAQYILWAESYYVKNGKQTSHVGRVRMAIRRPNDLHRKTWADDFGPNALRTVRESWIRQGLARRTVNDYTATLKHAFRWAVSREMISATVSHALDTVEPLRVGREGVRDTRPVSTVHRDDIEAVRERVSKPVLGLIDLQLLTAARPGELTPLRPCDLQMDGRVWVATLEGHKTAHRGRSRELWFGPKAKKVIKRFLPRESTKPLFSPSEAPHTNANVNETYNRDT